ncbi:MAG TPA: MarR family transcriptional regulator [Steroidobacteraceae bacterium]|jgi:DNA-binding MarR family transcriptional regulator|nr:MarR family transcriptional regulator [Steroidobacteraceae bacterium]
MARSPGFEVDDFAQTLGRLVRHMRAAAAQHELSLTESAVLARLGRHGPATTAELARAEGMRPQSMSAAVATLEERGFVERKPHPSDGRQMSIALTDKGAAIRSSTKDLKRAWLAQAAARLEDEERQVLARAGDILKRMLEK